MMRRAARLMGFGVAVAAATLGSSDVRAQGYGAGYPTGGYPSYGYGYGQTGVAVQVGVGGAAVGGYYPLAGSAAPVVVGGGYGGVVYGGSPGYVAARRYPSPAARQGFREGEVYYETGLAPNRPLSPAEARGFAAGERRAAATPWQVDPARQQGYREGQVYWETGLAPNRPLSPAEAQGFQAGERRASGSGYGSGYGYPASGYGYPNY